MSKSERASSSVDVGQLATKSKRMWMDKGLILMVLCIITSSWAHSNMERESELQKIFQLRKEEEWKTAWHLEKHGRCRDQLLTHMDWACKKDIYRLDKKKQKKEEEEEGGEGVWIRRAEANTIIKPWTGYVVRRKRENKSITDECCNTSGCTWEEYAEYCPAHRRARMARSRTKK